MKPIEVAYETIVVPVHSKCFDLVFIIELADMKFIMLYLNIDVDLDDILNDNSFELNIEFAVDLPISIDFDFDDQATYFRDVVDKL